MDQLSLWAQELHDRLGGPNFSRVAQCALQLTKKRRRDNAPASTGLVSRNMLMISSQKYVSPVMSGMSRLKKFLKLLQDIDVLYKKRSIGQRDFHDAFTIASLPHIVGEEDWDKHRASFLEFLDTDEYRGEILITTPRRFGKTTAVSMFVACLLLACPGMWVSIFSTGQRASKSLLVQIREVLDVFPGSKKRIISSNVEELYIQPLNTTLKKDVSRCFSYPSSVKGSSCFFAMSLSVPRPIGAAGQTPLSTTVACMGHPNEIFRIFCKAMGSQGKMTVPPSKPYSSVREAFQESLTESRRIYIQGYPIVGSVADIVLEALSLHAESWKDIIPDVKTWGSFDDFLATTGKYITTHKYFKLCKDFFENPRECLRTLLNDNWQTRVAAKALLVTLKFMVLDIGNPSTVGDIIGLPNKPESEDEAQTVVIFESKKANLRREIDLSKTLVVNANLRVIAGCFYDSGKKNDVWKIDSEFVVLNPFASEGFEAVIIPEGETRFFLASSRLMFAIKSVRMAYEIRRGFNMRLTGVGKESAAIFADAYKKQKGGHVQSLAAGVKAVARNPLAWGAVLREGYEAAQQFAA